MKKLFAFNHCHLLICKRAMVLTTCLLFCMRLFAYDFKVDGVCYNILSATDLTVEVTYEYEKYQYNDRLALFADYWTTYDEQLVIPSTIVCNGKNYTVTKIGKYGIGFSKGTYNTFYMRSQIKFVSLPETIINISENAFSNCENLEKIELPNSLITIGDFAFEGCNSLKEIRLPSSLDSIGYGAFQNCEMLSLTIPENVKSLGRGLPSTLKELIMLPYNPPETGWTKMETSAEIVVPVRQKYLDDEHWKGNKIVEMLTPNQTDFNYCGEVPNVGWTNNLKAYTTNVTTTSYEKNAGKHSVDITANFYNDNNIVFTVHFPFEYTINKALLNVKANDANREYGEENPVFSLSYSGFIANETDDVVNVKPVITTDAKRTSDVGDYKIYVSGGSAVNYELIYTPGTLKITKAPLSAIVKDTNRQYGSNNPQFELIYFGLKNEETQPEWVTPPTLQTSADRSSNIGQYPINAIGGVTKNYDIKTIGDGILNITPAPLTITANDAARQYYSENQSFSYTCKGFVNGDDEKNFSILPIVSTTAIKSSPVGSYEIKATGAECANYKISYINGTLTITPRTLTVSVGNYEKIYGEENPEFVIVYEGFAENEDEKNLFSRPSAQSTANSSTDAGEYIITISGGNAENYIFSYIFGKLTINKAEQTIEWNQELKNLHIGDQVELNAHASSGLQITYIMDSTNCAELYNIGDKTYLDCIDYGQFSIIAVQEGNKNYYSSPRSRKKVLIVTKRSKFDVNSDGQIDISDIVATINVIASAQQDYKADVNEDKRIDISDIVAIINEIAKNGECKTP